MAIERTSPRLTVAQQISRNPQFGGRLLAITAKTSSGGIIRAAEAIKRLPHLIAAGIRVEIRTPGGNLLDNSALIGKIPKQIDALARGVDTLGVMKKSGNRASVLGIYEVKGGSVVF